MNIYRALKLFGRIKSPRIKMLGLWAMHVLGRRYYGVFFDPAMGCNIRCRMCYMSNPDKASQYHGEQATVEQVDRLAKTLFKRAVKLQIGCATEPLLSPILPYIVSNAKECGVPYISITTNGQRLTSRLLEQLIESGLSEITLSVHGFQKETYEYLMKGARFERFEQTINALKTAKTRHPGFKVRLNFVVNAMNVGDLKELTDGWLRDFDFDVLQLRPFQDMGDTLYTDHNLQPLVDGYDRLIKPVIERCQREGRTCLAPDKENIIALETDGVDGPALLLEQFTYYYVSVRHDNKLGSNHALLQLDHDTFARYSRRTQLGRQLFKAFLSPSKSWQKLTQTSTRKLNYKVR